jgi:hypothetical protein
MDGALQSNSIRNSHRSKPFRSPLAVGNILSESHDIAGSRRTRSHRLHLITTARLRAMRLVHMFSRILCSPRGIGTRVKTPGFGHWRSFRLALEELSLGLVGAPRG